MSAKEWLKEFLEKSPRIAAEVKEAANAAGYTWQEVEAAKIDLAVITARAGAKGHRVTYHFLPPEDP